MIRLLMNRMSASSQRDDTGSLQHRGRPERAPPFRHDHDRSQRQRHHSVCRLRGQEGTGDRQYQWSHANHANAL